MQEILLANGAWVTPVAYLTFVLLLLTAALASREPEPATSSGPGRGSAGRAGFLLRDRPRPVWTPACRAQRLPRSAPREDGGLCSDH